MKKILVTGIILMFLLTGSTTVSVTAMGTKTCELLKLNNQHIGTSPNNMNTADWTILVYLDGDNDLEEYAIDLFLEMAEVGSTDDVNIIVQFDRASDFDTGYGNWNTTKRFRIAQGMVPDTSYALMDIGEVNMGDPQTLIDFVTWTRNNYPASRDCLIIYDHGYGWNWICHDMTPMDNLEIFELGDALSTITNNGENPMDLIVFHACLMAMLEVAYEIEDYASYMAASEDMAYSNNWHYDDVFSYLLENPTISPETLGTIIVDKFTGVTYSVLNLGLLDNLKNAVDDFGTSLQQEAYRDAILNAMNEVDTYYQDFVDLYHLAACLKQFVDDGEIDAKAQVLMEEINNTVVAEKHSFPMINSHGITIYVPSWSSSYPYRTYNPRYENLLFAHDLQWDEFLLWYLDGTNINPPDTPEIIGPISGEVGVSYEYTIWTYDSDGDFIYYYIDWGDGNVEEWIGPYGCPIPTPDLHGYYRINLKHIYEEEGTYTIRAKAKDIFDLETDWGTLAVTMPLDLLGSHQSSSTPQSQPSTQPSSTTTTQIIIGSTTLLGKTTSR